MDRNRRLRALTGVTLSRVELQALRALDTAFLRALRRPAERGAHAWLKCRSRNAGRPCQWSEGVEQATAQQPATFRTKPASGHRREDRPPKRIHFAPRCEVRQPSRHRRHRRAGTAFSIGRYTELKPPPRTFRENRPPARPVMVSRAKEGAGATSTQSAVAILDAAEQVEGMFHGARGATPRPSPRLPGRP